MPNGHWENRLRESTPGWKKAYELACQALTLAMDAAGKAATRDHAANELAENALEHLQETFVSLYFHPVS